MSVIHRDIKPANLMIDKSGRLKVLDFGIARMLGTVSHTRDTIGTPGYMAPEQILGEHVDGRADLFSVGVVFYELLAYTDAFPGDTGPAITHRILNKEPVPLPRLVPDLNPEIQPIIERALKKNVDERFPDAESFRIAVSRVRKRFEDDTAQVAPTVLIRETPAPLRKTGSAPARRPSTDAVSVATPPPTDRDALARRRLAQLEAALGQGRTLLAAGDLEMALDFCQQALTFDEHHAGALELEQEIAAAFAARQAAVDDEEAAFEPSGDDFDELDASAERASAGVQYAPTVLAPRKTLPPVAPDPAERVALDEDEDAGVPASEYAPTVLAPAREARAPQPAPQKAVEKPQARKTQAPKAKTQAPTTPPRPQRPPGPSLLTRIRTAGAAGVHRSSLAVAAVATQLRESAPVIRNWGRAIVPTWRPTLPATRKQQMVWAGAGLALLLVVAAVIVATRLAAVPPAGTLVIDALPWGTVSAIETQKGERLPLPSLASTPLVISLPGGTYQVTVTGPPPESQTQRVTVRVDSNASNAAPPVRFRVMTPEDYFEPYLAAPVTPAEPPVEPAAAQTPAPAGVNP
jgi:hypothetical protein